MMHATWIRMAFLALALATALPAHSQEQGSAPAGSSDATYWPYQREFWNYFGATVGRTDYDCCGDRATGFKVFGGGRIRDIFGAEIGYVNLGKSENFGSNTKAQGVNLSLVLNAPIGNTFGLFAKAGTIYSWTKTDAFVPGAPGGKDDGFGFSWGVGATLNFNRNVALRVDWDRYRLQTVGSDSDADVLSAGLQFRF